MKKILILTPIIPYPLTEGGIVSQYAFADYLRKEIKLIFLFILKKKSHEKAVNDLKKLWPEVDIYTINCIPNKTNRALAFQLFERTISLLYKAAYFFHKSNTVKNKSIVDEDMVNCVNFVKPINQKYIEEIKRISDIEKPDIIQVEHFSFMNLIFSLDKNIPSVFVHHELQFARLETSAKIITTTNKNRYNDYIYKLTKTIEKSILEKYSAIFVFSEIDKQKLENLLVQNNIYNSPFPILDSAFEKVKEEEFKIEKLIFVGSDIHSPNLDGLKWFVDEVFEDIHKKTHLELHVIGRWTEENMKQFEQVKNIKFLGFVEDLKKYSRNSIQIVPIRVGSGIRTKILYSMAQFLPVVTTEIGIEGIEVRDNKEAMIAKNIYDFINKIEYLVSNQKQAFKIAQNAQNFVKNNFTQEILGIHRMQIYKKLFNK